VSSSVTPEPTRKNPATPLAGRAGVVTGAGRGVGRGAALRLAELGARVALIARSADQLSDAADEITTAGGTAVALPMDLARLRDPHVVRDAVAAAVGAPTILVNAAGVSGPLALVVDTDPEEWIDTIMINTVSSYVTCRAFVAGMIADGWGRIVNVSSAASLHTPGVASSAYPTSKVALNHFTRCLAAELVGTGVTATVIHPGEVKTEMWADISAQADRLGEIGAGFRAWAAWVDETGGDDPDKAVELVERIVLTDPDDAAALRDVNGRFLWIDDGLQTPIASW
jgi:NAD(P)-dependent dehydrogenase (short-subunit alcohol dehydrogenase family)